MGCIIDQFVMTDVKKSDFEKEWCEKVSKVKKSKFFLESNADNSMRTQFAIHISCVARGKNYHKKENFEVDFFKNSFPNIPVVGFFGYGEIGLIENDESEDEIKYLSYSSIFTLISLKT